MTTHTVSAEDGGIRLDRWFKRHHPGVTHALLQKHLRKGQVRVDGKKVEASHRIEAGQVIDMRFEVEDRPREKQKKTERPKLEPEDVLLMQSMLIHKDSNILVLNKPAGLAVQGGSKIGKSVDGMLGALQFDQKERPKLVHRLDRDTSGVLVIARTARVAAELMKLFSGKTVEKTYWALVNGCPLELAGVIKAPLAKSAHDESAYETVGVDHEEGKYAETEYRVIDQLARKYALMELKPLTGRTHQLRVHTAHIGHPIVGDHKYGGSNTDAKSIGVENTLHLHARRIVIPKFPGSPQRIDVTAPLPPHMKKSFEALGISF
jgi:23S rRNA pseudouridine955/2504/2580 synthase